MNKTQQIELAAKLLNITVDEATEYHSYIEEDSLVYVSIPEKVENQLSLEKTVMCCMLIHQ